MISACPDCAMGSEGMTLHKNDCPVVIGPRVPPALFAAVLRSMFDDRPLTREAQTMAKGWLSQYDAWRGTRG